MLKGSRRGTKAVAEDFDALDILKAAQEAIDQHGHEALSVAGGRALEMHQCGDRRGEAVWCKIMDEIMEIRRDLKWPR